jgi:hypothetical protein
VGIAKLTNVVTLFFWETRVGTLLCGKNPINIFNAYTWLLQMWVK